VEGFPKIGGRIFLGTGTVDYILIAMDAVGTCSDLQTMLESTEHPKLSDFVGLY